MDDEEEGAAVNEGNSRSMTAAEADRECKATAPRSTA